MSGKAWYESDKTIRKQLRSLEDDVGTGAADKLAQIIGTSRSSYYNRRRHPEEFRICELRKLDALANYYGYSIFTE